MLYMRAPLAIPFGFHTPLYRCRAVFQNDGLTLITNKTTIIDADYSKLSPTICNLYFESNQSYELELSTGSFAGNSGTCPG